MTEAPPLPEAPDGWHYGVGEGMRPLHEGGYYLHLLYRTVWENQHAELFYEARIDTVGTPPREHVLHLGLHRENENKGTITEVESHIRTLSVDVDDPEDEESQYRAEMDIHEQAVAILSEYTA